MNTLTHCPSCLNGNHDGTNGTIGCAKRTDDGRPCPCPCQPRQHTTTHYHLTINGTLSDPYLTETDAYNDEGLEDNPANGPEECHERCITDEHLTAYICRDTGNIPCSRYGRQSHELAPVALALLALWEDANGAYGDALDLLDSILSLLVNDSDEPETLILQNHGPREAARLLDYLDRDTIDACHAAWTDNY